MTWLFLLRTAEMVVVDGRWETETGRKKEQERIHLPLPESSPQPLEAAGIQVKMLDKTKGRGVERRRGSHDTVYREYFGRKSCLFLEFEMRVKHNCADRHLHPLKHKCTT